MATQRKRRVPPSKGPSQPKHKIKTGRSTVEKAFIVVGILIALSMILSLFVLR